MSVAQIKKEWAEAVGAIPDYLDDWPADRIETLLQALVEIRKTLLQDDVDDVAAEAFDIVDKVLLEFGE